MAAFRRSEQYQPAPDPAGRVWSEHLARWLVRWLCVHPNQFAPADRAALYRRLRQGRECKEPLERVLKAVELTALLLLVPGSAEHAAALEHREWRRGKRAKKGGGG